MQALGYNVVVDKVKESAKIVGGLELTEKQDTDVRYIKGTVISIGEEVPVIKVGDTVRYDKHAGHGIKVTDKLLFVMKAADIVIIE
ncbi:MAG: hypothetical protein ACKVJK_04680 [Methylophagaceae bacterium]|jgi:co-chaperonin GroES (HSP10)|tara:strand:- start:452 stop:709 length:258 start_codon:yes stop_codon:yes gene_type:complete